MSTKETNEEFNENDRRYHHIGDELLVEYYKKQNVITKEEEKKLNEWLKGKEAKLEKGNSDVWFQQNKALEQIKAEFEQLSCDGLLEKKKLSW